jgi:hypothetical protein
LDSICPTGSGKVAGVKIEIDDEKWAGGVEVIRLRQRLRRDKLAYFELWSAGINGISREKTQNAQNSRNFDMASRQDDGFEAGFFGRHSLEGRAWTGMGHAVLCKNSLRRGLTVQGVNSTMCI